MSLAIRFSKTSIPDLRIPLPAPGTSTPVSALKRQIRKARPADTSRRRLRLIHAGRVLPDTTDLSPLVRPIVDQHSSVTASLPVGEDGEPLTIWLHCSVGDQLTDEELSRESDTGQGPSTIPQPLGFDRLRSAGFSDQDIAQLRTQFNRLHGVAAGTDSDAARQLEERWIDEGASAPDTLPDGSPVGVYEDLLLGTVVGFFLGLLALFFLREGSIFTKRQQMAIIAGIIINVSFAILRVYY
ncbi:DUF2407 C-terminal domain-containing protein [Lipomyces starkeyi]|uniref:DSC E3 ubiquitin ligase complex subunit 3 C-terminal domain-containing protein n=1 Tax=Lipomyces starkeyi NRRL Y-11557 TaxID=675824 RepID=A0A1E3Q5K0_LIPST|nr:hypothetical protein LIPSTDRAFT_94656 [Lipomyces starkeyi NRRL Y-11557]